MSVEATKAIVPTSIRLKPNTYQQIQRYADENGTPFTDAIHGILDDAIAFFEPKLKELKDAVMSMQAQAQTNGAENEALKKSIDELTANEAEQTARLNEIIAALSGDVEALTNAHAEKDTALTDLRENCVNVRFTPEQMKALNELIEYRRQYSRARKDDENAQNPEQFVYVYLKDGIRGKNWKPDEYNYNEVFCPLDEHLQRLGLPKPDETPEKETVSETSDGAGGKA